MAVVIKVGETEAVSVDIGEKVYIQGDPGFSPTIEVTDITGGHRLTITDINGDKTVDVMNGAKGDKGATGDTGATGNGIEYITLNADYTLTVHYTNGTEWTSASIRGEKGDKGDTGATGPTGQPGQTGATPDISIGTVTTGAAGSQAEATMTGTPEQPVLNLTIPRGDPGEVTQAEFGDLADEVSQQKSAIDDLTALTNRKAGMLVDSVSGAIASFTPDATIPDLLGVTVDIEPVQAGSGDPSPDNVRPISGWDAVEVERTGKNLWGGTLANNVNVVFDTKPGQTYTISAKLKGTNDCYLHLNSSVDGFQTNELVGRILIGQRVATVTFTAEAGKEYALWSNASYTEADQIQIELGSTAHDYHPYTGNRYTIALGQTVYGGTLTIAEDGSVNALIDRAMVDLGTLGYSKSSFVQNGFVATSGMPDDFPLAPGSSAIPNWICSNYGNIVSNVAIESASVDYALAWRISGQNKGIIVKDSNYAEYYTNNDMASFKAAMSGIQLVYELATPIEIQLDPVTISTISGQTNNVWADAGNVSVEFAADLKHYIDSKIAAAVAALS